MFLNCHTYYSLRYGTLSPEDLVRHAAAMKIEVLVLTDINNTAGVFDFVKACRDAAITPLVGMEMRENNKLLYTCIAFNNDGFREINAFRTQHNLSQTPLPERAPQFSDVFVVYPWNSISDPEYLSDNEYIATPINQLNKLITSVWRYHQEKLVMWHPITFGSKQDYELHRHLRAIDNNTLLNHLKPFQLAGDDERPILPYELLRMYEQYPTIIKNTQKLINQCCFDFDFNTVKNKRCFTDSRYNDKLKLAELAYEGMVYRYGLNNAEARQRIDKELQIIDNLEFSAYFLIAWDIIKHSLSRGFYHVGRGSGANSIVAYCLRITDVDPIELNLYFERFLNPKRTSPPDFDIDYSWKERDKVQQYIFEKYGQAHSALLGSMVTFQGKSTLRELGKVYGLPKEEIDNLEHLAGNIISDPLVQKIVTIGEMMSDFPNLRSIHAGGILISNEPITGYTSLDLPPKGFPTTQFDMYTAEQIGFEKLDILSQRGIGHIKECAEIVYQNKGISIDVHQVDQFKNDINVKERLRNADTTGCFYIESPAMRGLLKKLECSDYLTLVAASSIIRPGVARSGMMKQFIERFHNQNSINYLHPVMKDQLEETFGVMVYQEDVIKVCHHFAGLDLADADVLRRAMSGKFRSKTEFQRIVDKFFTNCRSKSYSEKLISEVWRQIESFAGYSFSKAHSASYAVESFQSLYLKTYYPLEFMVAVINNFGGFYQTWLYVHEAKRCGAIIHVPNVNFSHYTTSIVGSDVYLGFVHLQNLESKVAQHILSERQQKGHFKSLQDFVNRTQIGKEQLILLIRVGAFSFSGKTKPQLLWEVHSLLNKEAAPTPTPKLFAPEHRNYQLPDLHQSQLEDAYDEIELLGFPVTSTWFDLLETSFRGAISANELINHVGKKVRMLGQLVTIKYVRTVKNETMNFGTFIDAEGNFFDTTHFPPSLKEYPFKGLGLYLILGKIVEEFGYATIEVEKMAKMPIKPDPRGL